MIQHLFTVDVEEYFQVAALAPYVPRARWDSMESRLALGVDRLLELLDQHNATGTFFTLGVVAEKQPHVVRRIAEAGHELASHGWSHRSVTALSAREFRDEVARSRDLLANIAGQPIVGYRAPNFSIAAGWEWAFDILLDEGYEYDSSIFPGRRSGGSETRRKPWYIQRTKGALLEIPMTCAHIGRMRIPAAGGAWLRLFPYGLTRMALRQAEDQNAPGVFYIHPWELDPGQPRLPTDLKTRIRHYGNLSATEARIQRMLSEFSFVSIAKWRTRQLEQPAVSAA